jgi:hypothetical protein
MVVTGIAVSLDRHTIRRTAARRKIEYANGRSGDASGRAVARGAAAR